MRLGPSDTLGNMESFEHVFNLSSFGKIPILRLSLSFYIGILYVNDIAQVNYTVSLIEVTDDFK